MPNQRLEPKRIRLAAEQLLCNLVNGELRRAAARLVRGNHQLAQPTSLVNEVFLRLFRKRICGDLKNRRYFLAVAVDQMRQILRERWRARQAQKQGGGLEQVPLDVALDHYLDGFRASNHLDFIVLDEALERLQQTRATPRQFEILKLHFFLSQEQKEIAETIGLDPAGVSRELKVALAKLKLELTGDA